MYTVPHMEAGRLHLWRGMRPLIGTMIGVGMFGLPYAFAQAGYPLALAELLLIAGMNLVVLLMYSDLAIAREGHARFVGVIGEQLGPFGRVVAAFSFFASMWGALTAYVIAGGSFAHVLLGQVFGGSETLYQILFWVVCSLLVVGGLSFVNRMQAFVLPGFLLLLAALVVFALPHIDHVNLAFVHPEKFALPLGVILFAFGGISAIPEVRDVLGKDRKYLARTIALATAVVLCVYGLFTMTIVGTSGAQTGAEPFVGLAGLSPFFVLIGALFGVFVVFTAFINLSTAAMNTLLYDYRLRYKSAWLAAVGVPFLLYLIGSHDMIKVVGLTGGLLSPVIGILIVLAHEKARFGHHLPKRALPIPVFAAFLAFATFAVMFVVTLVSI